MDANTRADELPAPPVPAVPLPSRRDEHELSAAYRAPENALQERLTGLWAEALKVTPIGIDDDFFELGGHSLLAAGLLADIQREIGREITARTLFLQPTVAELAAAIEDGTAD